jgi:hypothetical protein
MQNLYKVYINPLSLKIFTMTLTLKKVIKTRLLYSSFSLFNLFIISFINRVIELKSCSRIDVWSKQIHALENKYSLRKYILYKLNSIGLFKAKYMVKKTTDLAYVFVLLTLSMQVSAQITGLGTGCLYGRWGIDAGLYSGTIEFGAGVEPVVPPYSRDWFQGTQGDGTINQTNTASLLSLLQGSGNPTYEARMKYNLVSIQQNQILIDGLYARDYFGGTGFMDATSFNTASKNGEDFALWDPGMANVLGKNDIIDVGGHMYRDGLSLNSNLWFVGLFNMAEPGGTSYMDFEFLVKGAKLIPRPGGGIIFSNSGPQLGHTAYTFDVPGNITKIGDFIFSIALSGSGPVVETRLWVSFADWTRLGGPTMQNNPTFKWAGTFDGAYNNAPFGYAGILPLNNSQVCGYVNKDGEFPLAPPWGSKGTKTNTWITNYIENSVGEVGINLTALGMDHSSLSGSDTCFFPLNTFIVKTRASASFTAQLKDFSGPYEWGRPSFDLESTNTLISCANETATITINTQRNDVNYLWSTLDGNILNVQPYSPPLASPYGNALLVDPNNPNIILGVIQGSNPWQITVNKVGKYNIDIVLPTNCPVPSGSVNIGLDPAFPFFNGQPTYTTTVPCNANDGTVTVTATGATKPYTFFLYKDNVLQTQFTGGAIASTHTFTGLTSGNYRVDVKGQDACIVTTGPFTIPDKIPVVVTPTLTNVNCFGDKTGAINLGISGGKPPLTYLWSTGNTSQNLLNIGAGTYTITVTDSVGCNTVNSYTIMQPTKISGIITKVDDPGNSGLGSASINASGGSPMYTYLWTKPGDLGFVFQPSNNVNAVTNLSYGEYKVMVTDASNCSQMFTVFIFAKEVCNDGIDNDGDGLSDCDDPDCTPVQPGMITPSDTKPCVDADGMAPYEFTYTYSLVSNPNYDSYVWTVPNSAVIVSGQGTNSITVAWTSTSGGQICVKGKIFNCLSVPTCISVIVNNVPPPATSIIID